MERHESRIQFNEERLRELESQNSHARWRTSRRRKSAAAPRATNWQRCNSIWRIRKRRWPEHREALEKKQAALSQVENDCAAIAGGFAGRAIGGVRRSAGFDTRAQ